MDCARTPDFQGVQTDVVHVVHVVHLIVSDRKNHKNPDVLRRKCHHVRIDRRIRQEIFRFSEVSGDDPF